MGKGQQKGNTCTYALKRYSRNAAFRNVQNRRQQRKRRGDYTASILVIEKQTS